MMTNRLRSRNLQQKQRKKLIIHNSLHNQEKSPVILSTSLYAEIG